MAKSDQTSNPFLWIFLVLLTSLTPLAGMTTEVKNQDSDGAQSLIKAGAQDLKKPQKIILSEQDHILIDGYIKRVPACTTPEELDGLLYNLLHDPKLKAYCDSIDEGGDRLKLIIKTVAGMLVGSNIKLNKLRNEDKATVLHCAAARGDCTVVEILCLARADVNARDLFGETPMHYAAKGRKDERSAEVCMLLGSKYRANVLEWNDNSETALHRAAEFGNLLCCRVLIDLGSLKAFIDRHARTPFFHAATNQDSKLCALFINAGFDWTATDEKGRSVRDCAPKIIDQLVWEKRKNDIVWLLSGLFETMLSLVKEPEKEEEEEVAVVAGEAQKKEESV